MISHWGLAGFATQLWFAEILFLYPAEKKPRFLLRFLLSWAALTLLPLLVPDAFLQNIPFQLCLFLLLFGLSVLLMKACFSMRLAPVMCCCVEGYAVQHTTFHLCSLLGNLGVSLGNGPFGLGQSQWREALLFPLFYLCFFLTLGRFSEKNESYKHYDKRIGLVSFTTVFICVGLSRIARFYGTIESITVNLYAITSCVMALMFQTVLFRLVTLRHENETVHLLWQEERRQYALSKTTMETINIKYHDLKRLLGQMSLPQEEVDAIKGAVRVYGSRFQTGNEALDVLLTQNSLRLGEEGISLSYMGGGEDFSFMNRMDVYFLFGNALDNAVEAVRQVQEKEKRFIDIVAERRGNLTAVTMVNYFQGEITFREGIPATSKKEDEGFHGYGFPSMRRVAQKYGGDLEVSVEGQVFTLCLYFLNG